MTEPYPAPGEAESGPEALPPSMRDWPTESGRTAKVEAIGILDEQQRYVLAPLTAAGQQQLGALLKRLQRPPRRPVTPG